MTTAGDPQATSRKSERLLNLLIMLLVQRHYVSKERIRTILYADSSRDAFEKMFERDKEELRSLGVPIEVGSIDPLFDDEPGYRISPDEFALPDIRLAADEAAVVGLATRVWEHARLAEATTDAVRKLTAAGIEVDVSALDIVEPRLSADEPAFDVFWDATQQRQAVEFEYQRPGHPDHEQGPRRRHLQPWGVVRHAGRWYVVGLDTDRGEERVFRLSRVVGDARRIGSPSSYDIPDGVDLRETTRRLAPPPSVVEATLLVRKGAGATLRRAAATTEHDVPGPDTDSPWDRVTIRRDRLAEELLALGPDVVVESPAELREEIVARLRATVGTA
jgi:proteasome accessory factor B